MNRILRLALAAFPLTVLAMPAAARPKWTEAEANVWYSKQPWLVGANYLPANAINQLEMWQPDTFDAKRIDLELGWAHAMGMNTMRVFLHDLLWQQDPEGYKKRIDTFLAIAQKHGIKPLFVLFDSCWDPLPKLGSQHRPIPGVHNSGWVQSPGTAVLEDPSQTPRLQVYVKGVIGAFANDKRILGWDVWNEPDNGAEQYKDQPADKAERVAKLLPQVFAWARSVDPTQPLTSGVWRGDNWSKGSQLAPTPTIQLSESDVITFHDYGWPEQFTARIDQLKTYGRPIICTEYMARGNGSTFDGSLPIGKRRDIGMINWGFVDGKEQTRLPWDSWKRPYVIEEPVIWFHDVLHTDGTPYRAAEVALIKRMAAAPRGVVPVTAE
jgi:hypothetical protein